ncbi:hypothetical protein T02_5738 [Trichinella nativa]|uniref:Uncharacterized protein n=1 Tax=Trichinella nativa TaxID=6335 RepID=A0A0V1LH76_9BILA|nr:hypothetical protein T02_5738 [Trichinella nativa]
MNRQGAVRQRLGKWVMASGAGYIRGPWTSDDNWKQTLEKPSSSANDSPKDW